MEDQVLEGKARSIGISNFNEEQIERVWKSADRIKPAMLQVELFFHFQQKELVCLCHSKNIKFSPWLQRVLSAVGVFDFELSMEEMGLLDAQDKGNEGRILDFVFFKGVDQTSRIPFLGLDRPTSKNRD